MPKSDYKKEMLSLIVTVFNEADTIEDFLLSVQQQSLAPTELIIVDAQSTDNTVNLIKKFAKKTSLNLKLLVKAGNRSVGRNFAARHSRGTYLAITDAGCILDKNWLQELWRKQQTTDAPVVAGYYQGLANTAFEEATIPYFLVMPERVRDGKFLPATRSMLIKKSLWLEMGGLNEKLSISEDYHLANRLKNKGIKIAFSRKAIVYWLPPSNIKQFFQKIFAFAKGDAATALIRPKVYLIFLAILVFFPNLYLIFSLIFLYLLWAMMKNLKYCPRSFFYLPMLQVVADVAVMIGTSVGRFQANLASKD